MFHVITTQVVWVLTTAEPINILLMKLNLFFRLTLKLSASTTKEKLQVKIYLHLKLIQIHEPEFANSGQPTVPGKYLAATNFKYKNFLNKIRGPQQLTFVTVNGQLAVIS